MSRKLYIFGTQNFADMAHYFFTEDSAYEVAGFTVDARYLDATSFKGLPGIAYEELLLSVKPEDADLFVAVGVGKINMLRAQTVARVQADGYRLASFISSTATVPRDQVVGANTMIMDHANIHPHVRIGLDTI